VGRKLCGIAAINIVMDAGKRCIAIIMILIELWDFKKVKAVNFYRIKKYKEELRK
jgi:hypothetical protein